MLVDDVTIKARAGKGGDGVVRFNSAMMEQGPSGGNGGNGGSVILRTIPDLGALRVFRSTKNIKARAGEDGAQYMCTGADGDDAVVLVPVGTVAHDLTSGKKYDLSERDQEVVVVRGGNGGFGNFHFRSSRHTSPDKANDGELGQEHDIRLELKMIADIGFVGLPNVGKSSLLNVLTNASSKVANYQFTTLDPHLGVYYDLILADIPGLIEGAADGKGLGHKFLKHVERTRVLFHFVAADSDDPLADYLTIRKELGAYNKEMLKKPEWIIISRSDERTPEEIDKIIELLKRENPQTVALSIIDDDSLKAFRDNVLTKVSP